MALLNERKSQTNRVIILGAGQIGIHIMQQISKDGYNVVMIDNDPEALAEAGDMADVQIVESDGSNPTIYMELKINKQDMFVAVTNSDEINLIACRMAKAFGCETKIARVRKPWYHSYQNSAIDSTFWKRMGVEVLFNQSDITTREILHLLDNPGTIDTVSLHKGDLYLNSYRIKSGSPFCGRRLIGLRDIPAFENIIVTAVKTSEDSMASQPKSYQTLIHSLTKANQKEVTIIPRGDYRLQEGDLVTLCGLKDSFGEVGALFDPNISKVIKKIFILGGSEQSYTIGEELIKKYPRKDIFMIEQNKTSANKTSAHINEKIQTLCCDIRRIDELNEEGLNHDAVFIGASNNEDDNLLSCMVAKEEAQSSTIAIVQNTTYMHLMPYLHLDAAVSPKILLANEVLKALRRNVFQVLSAKEQDTELIEVVASENCLMVGKQLKDFRFPEQAIIVAIYRGERQIIIPRGDTSILLDDHLIIYALKKSLPDVQHIFRIVPA
jgi:trk system potassium uptake protein TrkA